MFDLPDDILIDDGCVQGLQEELDVSITIKPKSRQANKTVIIRTQERNASAIYRVCHDFFIFLDPLSVPFTQLIITIVCSPLSLCGVTAEVIYVIMTPITSLGPDSIHVWMIH